LHFGLPCRTWGPAGRLAGGTRRAAQPLGDGTLSREIEANAEWDFAVAIWATAVLAGSHVTLENPRDSYVFSTPGLAELRLGCQVYEVEFDQCGYGLQVPGCTPIDFCRKRTKIISTSPALAGLARSCPGLGYKHQHVRVWGQVKVNGTSYSRTEMAGAYPQALCRIWAQATKESLLQPPRVLSRSVLVRLAGRHRASMTD
jgi:hypothetical protein